MNKITLKDLKFLEGEKFSNSYSLKLNFRKFKLRTRQNIIDEIVQDKSIIHFGCTDHLPLIDKKISNNTWFHQNLSSITKKCTGLDSNEEAIEYLKREYKVKDIYTFDIYKDSLPDEIKGNNYDYIFLGEILEHINNPVIFLEQIKQTFFNTKKIIITVPNAFCLMNFKKGTKNKEAVNSDHRFWFTPYTLSKVCAEAGIKPLNYVFYVSDNYNFLESLWLRRFNIFQDGIICIGELNIK